MDPGWVASPPDRLRCVLCNVLLPRYAERLFRHLIQDHRAHHNLNLLLELSVGGGVWLPPSPPPEVPLFEGSPASSHKQPRESKIPWPWNPLADHLQDPTRAGTPSARSLKPSTSPASWRCLSSGSEIQPTEVKAAEEASKQVDCEPKYVCSDGQVSSHNISNNVLVSVMNNGLKTIHDPVRHQNNQTNVEEDAEEQMQVKADITWVDPGSFSPVDGEPSLLPPQPIMHSGPSAAEALNFPAFSIRDPIVHFQPHQRFIRRTRDELVKKNNKAQVMMHGVPNRNIVTEELQHMIVTSNQGRSVHFTKSQRDNVQLVLDDFILKKKKGPFLSRGMQVISWRCTVPGCHFTASTKEGSIVEGRKPHSHPARPDLVVKKEAYARVRRLVSLEEEASLTSSTAATLVQEAVGKRQQPNDALKQAARRYRRRSSGARSAVEKELEGAILKQEENHWGDINDLGQLLLAQGDSYESSLLEVSLPENCYNGTSMSGNFAAIPAVPDGNPSTVEFTLNPEIVEVILNPDTLEATLIHPEAKVISPGPDTAILCNQAALNASAETRAQVETCEVLPITSTIELAHSSVPEAHLEIHPPSDLPAAVESKVNKQEESAQHGGSTRNGGDTEEVSAGMEFVPDFSFKSSGLVYVSDFTEDSDIHEEDGERGKGSSKEIDNKDHSQNAQNEATIKDVLDKAALKNGSLDSKVDPTGVKDDIEDFDEKVALVKAKLDLENSEESKVVEAAMAGLNDQHSSSEGVARIQDGEADDAEEVVVEKHIQECIESVIEHGRGDIDDVNECKEGGVDIGQKPKRKLRRNRWTWL